MPTKPVHVGQKKVLTGLMGMRLDSHKVLQVLEDGVEVVEVDGEKMLSVSVGNRIIGMGNRPNRRERVPLEEPAINSRVSRKKLGLEE